MTVRRRRSRASTLLQAMLVCLTASATACSIEATQGEVGVYRPPVNAGGGEGGGSDLPEPGSPLLFLPMVLRDFKRYDPADKTTNPAFDNVESEKSVVADTLGDDGKPVYVAPGNALPTFGAELFKQWYRDVPGTNYRRVYPLPLSRSADGQYQYDSQISGEPDTYQGVDRRVFFPLDDGTPYATPFGNQGAPHNRGFTGELHAVFTLDAAGGALQVRSDDDCYVFVDGTLVVDLGGTHIAGKPTSLSLGDLGLGLGEPHFLDVFYAERQGATGDFLLKTDVRLDPRVVE